ncbi:MAG: S41 family peptidase [Candidatus Omnitrophota bacterium]
MRRRIFISAIVLAASISVISALVIFAAEQIKKESVYPQLELFSDALTIVHSAYVDQVSVRDLIYGALKGMLSSLDPHSQFLDPEAYKELKVETEGQFGGLGIEITIKDNLLTIITPIEDTPAWKAGVKTGDRIVKIDGELTRDITLPDAVKKLRGKPGTEVNLTILRESESRILEIKIVRDIIKINDVKKAQILEDNIGYIRLIEFREDTAKEFEAALKRLKESKMDALILDVRYNPGGLLDVAIDITSSFLPKDSLVVWTKSREEGSKVEFKSKGKDHLLDLPMIVLINEGSASGSEILAGALQDHHRAIIMGTKSFGKGSVQTVIPMGDGSALRLTTSKYFTPSGRSIHNIGIEPDIIVEPRFISEDESEEKEDIFKKLEENENSKKEKEKPKSEEKMKQENPMEKEDFYRRDAQLLRALDLLKAIKVYNKNLEKAK